MASTDALDTGRGELRAPDGGDVLAVDDALALAASFRLEDDRCWGERAIPEQVADMAALLDGSGPRLFFNTRGRGGSKTMDGAIGGLALLSVQAPPDARCYAVAADADQAALLLDTMRGLVRRTPGLAGAFRFEARRVVAVDSGASFEVLAADGPSAFGLRPWLTFADELAVWPETPNAKQVWEAVVSATPKVPGARLVVLTSAGSPSHWSHKVLEQARRSAQWRTSEWSGAVPWIAETALDEQRALLTPSAFRRYHLNEWAEPEDRLVLLDDLRACVTLDAPAPPRPDVTYVASLDMAYVNDQAVAAVCHRDADGTVVLDRMEAWQGSRRRPVHEADVEAWLVESWRAYHRPRLVLDPWQTKGMAQRLRSAGLHVDEFVFSAQSVGRIALTLYRLLRDHALALYDDEALLDELARVRLRETSPGVYRLDHASGEHDDRAVALALAAHTLLDHSAPASTDTSLATAMAMGSIRAPAPAGPEELRMGSW